MPQPLQKCRLSNLIGNRSNSLSKAAGDWPFVVAEVSTPTAWEIFAYVAGLTGGTSDGRELKSTIVWKSTDHQRQAAVGPVQAAEHTPTPLWEVNLELFDLDRRNKLSDASATAPVVRRLISELPADSAPDRQARWIMEGMNGRSQLTVAVPQGLAFETGLEALRTALDEALIQDVLDNVAPKTGKLSQLLPPIGVLLYAGSRLAVRPKGTNLLKTRVNAAVHGIAGKLELGGSGRRGIQILFAGLAGVLVGLEVSRAGACLKEEVRSGIVTDYMHLLARLLRSREANNCFGAEGQGRAQLSRETFFYAVQLTRELSAIIGGSAREAEERLKSDPFIPYLSQVT